MPLAETVHPPAAHATLAPESAPPNIGNARPWPTSALRTPAVASGCQRQSLRVCLRQEHGHPIQVGPRKPVSPAYQVVKRSETISSGDALCPYERTAAAGATTRSPPRGAAQRPRRCALKGKRGRDVRALLLGRPFPAQEPRPTPRLITTTPSAQPD